MIGHHQMYGKFSANVNGLVLSKDYIWTNVFKHRKVASNNCGIILLLFKPNIMYKLQLKY